jgi:probable phosphoglycerate mutase
MSEPRAIRQMRFARPPGATELVLIRHGESAPAIVGEPFDLVDGQGDPPLSAEGEAQAERLGERLASEAFDAAYATSLRRTVQTAEPWLVRSGLRLGIEPDLREVHLGDWEGGVFRQKVMDQDPIALRWMEEQRWDVIPGAEAEEKFSGRVIGSVLRIAAAHPDERVAVFTHGGVIGRILAEATSSRPFAFGADNASISHLVVAPDRWTLRRFNDISHLETGFTVRAAPLT